MLDILRCGPVCRHIATVEQAGGGQSINSRADACNTACSSCLLLDPRSCLLRDTRPSQPLTTGDDQRVELYSRGDRRIRFDFDPTACCECATTESDNHDIVGRPMALQFAVQS